jgi:hypothetical protein
MEKNIATPPGQMTQQEKEYIFSVAKESKTDFALESGTWKGGGSTLDIVNALFNNNNGVLHTYEEWKEFYDIANSFYSKSKYVNYIQLHHQSFLDGLKAFEPWKLSKTNFVFLDGGDETPQGKSKLSIESYHRDFMLSENVQSFIYLEDKLPIGANLLLHDWSIPEGRGYFIRLYLNASKNEKFVLKNVIDASTGLAHLIKIK